MNLKLSCKQVDNRLEPKTNKHEETARFVPNVKDETLKNRRQKQKTGKRSNLTETRTQNAIRAYNSQNLERSPSITPPLKYFHLANGS